MRCQLNLLSWPLYVLEISFSTSCLTRTEIFKWLSPLDMIATCTVLLLTLLAINLYAWCKITMSEVEHCDHVPLVNYLLVFVYFAVPDINCSIRSFKSICVHVLGVEKEASMLPVFKVREAYIYNLTNSLSGHYCVTV